VFVDSTGTPDEIQNNTVSGDLTVRLDSDVAARYNVNTVSGTLQLGPTTLKGLRGGGYNGHTGLLESSWTEFRANSVSGNITVMFRDPETTGSAGAGAAPADQHADATAANGQSGQATGPSFDEGASV
jgi:hypothetical protein